MKVDPIIVPVMILIGVFGTLLVILALQDIYGGEYTIVAQGITPIIAMLSILAICFAALAAYLRR